MGDLSKLPNIGAVLERQLSAIGVTDYGGLCALGTQAAWLKIQQNDPTACLHRLLALEGAIRGVKKTELSPTVKAALRDFYNAHKL